MSALATELRTLFPDGGRVNDGDSARDQHAADLSYQQPARPDVVVYPESTAEVATILEYADCNRIPIVPFGAGTSLEGHVIPASGGITLDLSRLSRIVDVRPEDLTVTAQAGVTRLQLEAATGPHGLWFPVDPGADATLGGMAATNASGTTTLRYGGMRAHVLELEAVLPGGQVIRAGSRTAKTSAGYHVAGLLIGSEGTLGVITEVTLRLHPIPEHVVVARASFPSIDAACAATWTMLASGLQLSRCELLDAWTVGAVNAMSGSQLPEAPLLFIEIAGQRSATLAEIEIARECASDEGALTFDTVDDPTLRARLWRARHEALMAILARAPGSRAMITDVAVPLSELPAAIEHARGALERSTVEGGILGHVGDGNFHAVLLVDPERAETVREARRLNSLIVDDALGRSGTSTGEHGIGSGKMAYLEREHGDLFPLYRGIKAAFDPNGIMNPGKIF